MVVKLLCCALVLSCALLVTLALAEVRYEKYTVFRLIPQNEEQLQALREWEQHPQGLDFWTSARKINAPVDIMVAPNLLRYFHNTARKHNLIVDIFIEDVQASIDKQRIRPALPKADFNWHSYHNLTALNDWLKSLAGKYPDNVELYKGGSSYEHRNIVGVKLSYKHGNPKIFLESGIHAREWIAPAVATWILNQLLTSEDRDVRYIAENFDWYIFPSVNPDGYQYTHTTNRMWRKTRTPGKKCDGVDPNRNWDDYWNQGGASSNECDETYAGTSAFSTIECASLSETIKKLDPFVYFSFHSYSQLLMIPYGHRHEHANNYNELMQIGKKAVASLAQRYGTSYEYGAIIDVIYEATGGSMDWAKSHLNIPYPFEWELRDLGRHGFLLPPEQIIPTAEETFDSIITILKEISSNMQKN